MNLIIITIIVISIPHNLPLYLNIYQARENQFKKITVV